MADIPTIAGHAPYGIYSGTIEVTTERSPTGEIVNLTAKWVGEDKLIISKPLMDDLDPRWAKLDGDILTICQFTLKVLAYFPDEERYIAQRIVPPMESTQ